MCWLIFYPDYTAMPLLLTEQTFIRSKYIGVGMRPVII